ncbi:chemotaxis response regulator protein-glutamate methylesterase [Spongisporangium articulatum]|uniref:Protein-glutamate methylesterase/protein-glutamine glutaminase n=1 Tax=Spongisporangium articulatum TaxID=3362603 RepID=A0ABW8ALU1_9ACTN
MSAERIRVLVVDDSAVIRRLVTEILDDDPRVEVAGVARNGRIALEKIAELKPDAVTMDIEMPEMDGISAVRELRKQHPRLPVVMFSTLTERGASSTLDALAAGASDYVTKPSNVGSVTESRKNIREQLVPKLIALTGASRVLASMPVQAAKPVAAQPRPGMRMTPFEILAIGSSTGGPDALATVLRGLPASLPVPVVIVQHMPPLFTATLAARLNSLCPLTVSEAKEGDAVRAGSVLIAPGGFHLEVRRTAGQLRAHLTEDPPENYCRPAVDVLFRSVAATFGSGVLGLVLTGMGRDGASGAEVIRRAGGHVFAQDQATSVVWGMPGAVATAGQADRIVPLPEVAQVLSTTLARTPARQPAASGGAS